MDELSARGRERVYRVLSYLAQADAELARREERLLDVYRRKLELSAADAARLDAEAARGEKLQLKGDSEEAEVALRGLARLMVADGVLHPAEAERLRRIAAALMVSDRVLARAVQEAMIRQNQRRSKSDP